MKTFACRFSQAEIDSLGLTLYRDQTAAGLYSSGQLTCDLSYRLLSILRAECVRAGAQDMYPDLPMSPGIFEGSDKRRKRRRG